MRGRAPSGVAFANEPATDLTVPANRQWAVATLARPGSAQGARPVNSGRLVQTAVERGPVSRRRLGRPGRGQAGGVVASAADVMAVGPR